MTATGFFAGSCCWASTGSARSASAAVTVKRFIRSPPDETVRRDGWAGGSVCGVPFNGDPSDAAPTPRGGWSFRAGGDQRSAIGDQEAPTRPALFARSLSPLIAYRRPLLAPSGVCFVS